jgi:nucleotide-binding universal stress UspA family protein
VNAAHDTPVVVAYDGSAEAQAAVREAAALFGARRLLVVTVWERGLAAMAFAPSPSETGLSYLPPDPAEVSALDNAGQDHASAVADAGVRLARGLGATADALPVPDEADVAETIASIAEQREAGAVVVGSRGLGGVKRHLLGSTSQRLLRRTNRPVLVVRAPD